MNAANRKQLDAIISSCEDLGAQVEQLADEEQEKYDNLTDGLQQSERGQAMEQAASTLQEAKSALDEAISQLESARDG